MGITSYKCIIATIARNVNKNSKNVLTSSKGCYIISLWLANNANKEVDSMMSVEYGKELSREIVELLKEATPEQKLVIKGILMGAKEFENKVATDKKAG